MKPSRHAARRRAWLTASILIATIAMSSLAPEAAAATNRVLSITTSSANPIVAFKAFDGNPPKLFDINKDGIMEIIAQNDNQWVYVFDSKTGKILAQLKTTFPSGWGARSINGPEAAVMEQGGQVRLIVANSAAYVTSYRYDPGASSSTNFGFVKEWERRLSDCFANPGMDARIVFADLDLDGKFEIIAATEESGVFALRSNGQIYWKRCIGGGNGEPGIGDFDQNGLPDVVFGSDGGLVTAMRGTSGATMWSYHAPSHFNIGAGSMPVGPAVGQLDGKGGPDVVIGARDSHDATNFDNNHALLLALDSNGKLLWGRQDSQANPLTYTHPIIGDAAGDGKPEVYWGDWNTMGHKPPFNEEDAWPRTGPANFYRFSDTGTLVWRQTIETYWSNKDVPIADVDGDGVQEMLANGPGTGGDGIWYLSTVNGAKETFVPLAPWKASRAPVLGDLWKTGTMQWVIPVEAASNAVSGGAILVYNTHVPYNAMWPHVPYPEVGGAPPPPSGYFDATFRIKSPNPWWQEVRVEPDIPRTITKMEIRIGGSGWQNMPKQSWGAYATSQHTPAGTMVEFRAIDSAGQQSQSAPFTWLDGVLTQRNVPPGTEPPPPPPGPFTATFELGSGINEWWVEVKVRTGEPLSSVEARVNGGSWRALSPTSWGTWAKSFFVAAGSSVEFRATSTFGGTATSEVFVWLGGGTGFSPTFEPRSQTNQWWVEVKVTSGSVVKKVEVRVGSGAWIDLPATSWGTWAKSFFVPNGSSLVFRATNDLGNTAESSAYIWG